MKEDIYKLAVQGMAEMQAMSRKTCNRFALVIDGELSHSDETWCAAVLDEGRNYQAVASLTCYDYAGGNGGGTKLTLDERVLFFDWLCNHSPYSQCIVTKDPAIAANEGIILDGDYPANLVVGAIIASRISWEYRSTFHTMKKFIEAGMDSSAAFYMAHRYGIRGQESLFSVVTSPHQAIDDCNVDTYTLENFVNGVLVQPNVNLTAPDHGYDDIHGLFGDRGNKGFIGDNILVDAIAKYCADVGYQENSVPNPFSKSLTLKKEVKLDAGLQLQALVTYVNNIVKGK
jgi:hypothetical protein